MDKATKKELEIARKAFKNIKVTKVVEGLNKIVINMTAIGKAVKIIVENEQDL